MVFLVYFLIIHTIFRYSKKILILLAFLTYQSFLAKITPGFLGHYMLQKTSMKTVKIGRFGKILLVFFALKDDLIFFRIGKTSSDHHPALGLETN